MQTTTTLTPPRRTRRAGLVLVGLLLLAIGIAVGFFAFGGDGNDPRPASQPPAESSFEAEEMSVEEGVAVVDDGDAGRGRALRFGRDSSASIRFTTVAARRITIRARGDQCDGAPQAVVTVDGAMVLTADVASQSWQTYSEPATVAAGAHRIEISYTNNSTSDECDRGLFVDRVSFDATTAAPARTTSTPRPAPDAPPGGGSRVIWRGDFESGDLEQWGTTQRVEDDRIQVVRSPTRQGSHAARFEVREGDNVGDGEPRAELALLNRRDACCREGDERWYRWQTMFDGSFPTNPRKFVDFVQFKKDGEGGGPITFMVWGEQMEMRSNGTQWKAPLRRGQWEEFVFHVKWSPDPTVGFVELWHNGVLALPRKYMLTLDRDGAGNAIPAYLKQGLYRSDEFNRTGVVFQDGMVAGTTARAVGGTG